MKKYFGLLFILLISITYSCDNSEDYSISEKTIIVDSKKVLAIEDTSAKEVYWLRIRNIEKEETDWFLISGINGFDYIEGFSYKLRVKERINKNPLPDQEVVTYEFIELISKTSVTKE